MPEYIERESLLKKAKELAQNFSSSCLATPHIIKAIENAPKADVENVVRCKDCKYTDVVTCPITGAERMYCDFGTQPVYVKETHFCGYGVRKEGAKDA